MADAEQRLGRTTHQRRPRSDRGRPRVPAEVLGLLQSLLLEYDKPAIRDIASALERQCHERHLRCPSRASIYKLLDAADGHTYTMTALPAAVQHALYNLGPEALVPGRQVAFYCFNYGDLAAICFAAGMPWLDLYQAARLRGWRDKSRGLLEAVCRARQI
jgi:hypothetical protein